MKNMLRYGTRFLVRNNFLFGRKLRAIRHNAQRDISELHECQMAALLRTLETAIRNIPFYKGINLTEKDHESPERMLSRFPVISKEQLLENREMIYPTRGRKKPWWSLGKTSGTTGTPLEVFRSYSSVLYENAFLRRHWEWCVYKGRMKRASMRGDLVVPLERKDPPLWFFNPFENQLLLSSRHLRQGCFEQLAEALEKFSPYLLEAYPSTAYELARYLRSEKRNIKIPFVYTGSEILYQHQRELIAERFQCKILDFYGMAERVAFAGECEYGNLHLNTDYSFVEILDDNNQPTTQFGYVVGTTFHNLTMPLVRYKLSDISKWKPGKCECGRTFPMLEPIQGKFEDVLYGGEGNPISPSVLTFAFKGVHNIVKSQVAQIREKIWEVRIVPGADYSKEDQDKLFSNIHQLVDPTVKIQVKLIEDIPRESSGKFRWVVNEWQAGAYQN